MYVPVMELFVFGVVNALLALAILTAMGFAINAHRRVRELKLEIAKLRLDAACVDDLRTDAAKLKAEAEDLRSQITELHAAAEEARALRAEMDSLRENLANMEAISQAQAELIGKLTERVKILEDENHILRAKAGELEKKNGELEEKNGQLEKENGELKKVSKGKGGF